LLGFASYLAVMGITNGRARLFAMALGTLTAVFLCSVRIDSIHWNFVGALACSLLSVWCFAQFINSGRHAAWLSGSLVLWLLAIQTYTLQTGGMLAVGVLSLAEQGQLRSVRDLTKRILQAAIDVLPYILSLLFFVMVWRTTATSGITESTDAPSLSLLGRSLIEGAWHSDYAHYAIMVRHLAPDVVLLVLVVAFPVLLLAQGWIGSSPADESVPICIPDLVKVLLVGICLAVPTVLLESTSTMFPPGTRWRMILQFWTPLMSLTVLAVAILIVPVKLRFKRWLWVSTVAGLAAWAILSTLAYNQKQVEVARSERRFISQLRRVAMEDKTRGAEFPRHYLIKLAPGLSGPSEYASRVYTRNAIRNVGQVTYRYITSTPVHPHYELAFLQDQVKNPEFARLGSVPYTQVGILAWDGVRMERIEGATQTTFEGLVVKWERDGPLP
jgi:hypothetical protein